MKVYNIKKVQNIWYEESCDFCINTIFEGEICYIIDTDEPKSVKKCCKKCIESIYKKIDDEK